MKLCPRCRLPTLHEEEVLNSLSHDGETYICSACGKIESLKGLGIHDRAYGLELTQRRAQAALYGLDEKGDPKLPEVKDNV